MSVLVSGPFTIVLDGAGTRRTWTAGDVVRGKARLYSTSDEAVESVSVRFGGRAKSKEFRHRGQNNQRQTYRGRAQFFEINALLYRSHFTLAANKSYEWPFEFTFPSLAPGVTAQNAEKWSPGGPYCTSDQPLPPTMSDKWKQLIGGRGHEAFIEYTLVANLTRPGGGSILNRGYEHQLSLLFLQAGPAEAHPVAARTKYVTQPCTIKSLRLHPDNQNRELTIREMTRSVFKKDKLPYFAFDLFLSKMQQVHLGEAHPMTLSLRHKPEASSPLPVLPVVILQTVQASVTADTNVRSERGVFSDHSSSSEVKTPCVIHYNSAPGNSPGPFTEANNYSKSFFVAPLNSPHFVSNFATFNITRSHRLTVKATVVCAGETVQLSCTEPLTIFPMVGMVARADAPVVDSLELTAAKTTDSPAGPSNPDNQTLPIYENVTAVPSYSEATSSSKESAPTAPTIAAVISKAVYQDPIYTNIPDTSDTPSSPQLYQQSTVPEPSSISKAREAGFPPEAPPEGYVLAYVPAGAAGAIPAKSPATSMPTRVPVPSQSRVQPQSSVAPTANSDAASNTELDQSQQMLHILSLNPSPQNTDQPSSPPVGSQNSAPNYWVNATQLNTTSQIHSDDQKEKGKDWDRTY